MKKFLPILLLLASCAGQHDTWVKPHLDQRQLATDFNKCLIDAQMIEGNAGGIMGYAIFESARDRCMFGKGYTHMCGPEVCKE